MGKFHLIDRDIDFLLPPSVQEWLSEGHLARYLVEVVEGLDLGDLERNVIKLRLTDSACCWGRSPGAWQDSFFAVRRGRV